MTLIIAAILMTFLLAGILFLIIPSVSKPAACSLALAKISEENDGTRIASPLFEPKGARSDLEPSPEEISLYFKHKQCGNLEKARQLGVKLGSNILELDPSDNQFILSPIELSLARMLYLFVTEDCIRRAIHDPILLKLVLAQINDTITLRLPDFYNNLFQYRSYTVYKMCLTEGGDSQQIADRIGKRWAQMAGLPQDEQSRRTGAQLYLLMKDRCEYTLYSTPFASLA